MKNIGVWLIIAATIAARLPFIMLFPFEGGDWDIYSTVAENILRGCGVSLSSPSGAECIPHFGGNHLPGFPTFVALIWTISAHSDMAIRIAQLLLYAAAVGWMTLAVSRFTQSNKAALSVGFVMALSPLQLAWPRYLQTETLTLAVVIWFFAEILMSFAQRRIRTIPVALAIVAATFLRLDGIALCVPAVTAALILHSPHEALRHSAIAAVIVFLPLTGWAVRNLAVGVSVFPAPLVMPDNAPAPYGYLKWGNTWVSEEYQRMGWAWPVNRFRYQTIQIDDKAFDSDAEKQRVKGLLAELAKYDRQPFPPHLDAQFAELARERAARAPFRTYIVIPAQRAVALWRNPFSSFGWPNEMPSSVGHQQRLDASRSADGMMALARQYPLQAASKALTAGYRFALLGLFVVIVALSLSRRCAAVRPIIWIVVAWIVARTIALALTNNVETRYTAPTTPAIELVVVLGVLSLLRRRRQSGLGEIQPITVPSVS
jgi:hypothetical protein